MLIAAASRAPPIGSQQQLIPPLNLNLNHQQMALPVAPVQRQTPVFTSSSSSSMAMSPQDTSVFIGNTDQGKKTKQSSEANDGGEGETTPRGRNRYPGGTQYSQRQWTCTTALVIIALILSMGALVFTAILYFNYNNGQLNQLPPPSRNVPTLEQLTALEEKLARADAELKQQRAAIDGLVSAARHISPFEREGALPREYVLPDKIKRIMMHAEHNHTQVAYFELSNALKVGEFFRWPEGGSSVITGLDYRNLVATKICCHTPNDVYFICDSAGGLSNMGIPYAVRQEASSGGAHLLVGVQSVEMIGSRCVFMWQTRDR